MILVSPGKGGYYSKGKAGTGAGFYRCRDAPGKNFKKSDIKNFTGNAGLWRFSKGRQLLGGLLLTIIMQIYFGNSFYRLIFAVRF
jgi:hypothetical protein